MTFSVSDAFAKKNVVSNGDIIEVHYKGTYPDGKVFDQSKGRGPLKFTVGAGQMIKGFDKAVVGMKLGGKKKVTLQPKEAYGPASLPYPKNLFAEGTQFEKGKVNKVKLKNGREVPVFVIDVKGDQVFLKNNHPLAGKTLIFEIEIISIH